VGAAPMSESLGVVERSLKLNRDLDRMLEQALELDRQVRIGWGRDGDERPKSGESGVITHLPDGSRIRLLGDLADCVGMANRGGTLSLEGNVGRLVGMQQMDGKILIEKNAGDRAGFAMSGGRIVIRGDVGRDAGAAMSGGLIVVRGAAAPRCGAGMSGGDIVVLAGCGADCGYSMSGGRIIIDGRAPPPGEGAVQRGISAEEVKEMNELMEDHGLKISSDAIVVETDQKIPIRTKTLTSSASGDFSGIRLRSAGDRLSESTPLDLLTMLVGEDADDGIVLHLPWLPRYSRGPSAGGVRVDRQPCIVDEKPRAIDLLRIDSANLTTCIEEVADSGGVLIDLAGLPKMDDAEIDALRIACESRLAPGSPVLLGESIDHVDRALQVAKELGLTGVVIDACAPGRPVAIQALPTIGLSARRIEVSRKDLVIILALPWVPSAQDALIAAAAGCSAISGPAFAEDADLPKGVKKQAQAIDGMLDEMEAEMRGWLVEAGVDSIDRLDRRHLRAVDHPTASSTGLRLDGLDRPLPHWLGK